MVQGRRRCGEAGRQPVRDRDRQDLDGSAGDQRRHAERNPLSGRRSSQSRRRGRNDFRRWRDGENRERRAAQGSGCPEIRACLGSARRDGSRAGRLSPVRTDGPLPRSAHARAKFRARQAGGRHVHDAAGAPACGRARHRSVACLGFRPAWPHRRCRRRKGSACRARRWHGARRQRGAGQGAVRGRRLRGSAARLHAPHDRDAADRGQADHSAFLSDRRFGDRPADRHARGGQCRRAAGQRRPAGVQALAQRFHHQGLGDGAATRAGSQCRVGRRPHPAFHPFRYWRGGGARRRA